MITWRELSKKRYKTKAGAERAIERYTSLRFFRASKSRRTGLYSIKERR
tara:strand:- start:553 stop:699 length:147 start_codon:yes stop_codon:yes gene_type:complete